MDEKPKFPLDTSWDFSGTMRRLRDPWTWVLFAIIFCVTAPVAGFVAFWLAFADGMASFGPSYKPSLLIWFLTRLPVPHQNSLGLIILNAVLWSAIPSLVLAMLLSGKKD